MGDKPLRDIPKIPNSHANGDKFMSRDIQLIARLTRLASVLASGRVVIEDEVRTPLEELIDHVLHHDFDR